MQTAQRFSSALRPQLSVHHRASTCEQIPVNILLLSRTICSDGEASFQQHTAPVGFFMGTIKQTESHGS